MRCLRGHSLPAGLSRRSGTHVMVMMVMKPDLQNLSQSCLLSVRIVQVDVLGAFRVVAVGTCCVLGAGYPLTVNMSVFGSHVAGAPPKC